MFNGICIAMPANNIDGGMGDIEEGYGSKGAREKFLDFKLDNELQRSDKSFLDDTPVPEQGLRSIYFNKNCWDCMPAAPIDGIISSQNKIVNSYPPKEIKALINQIEHNQSSAVLDKLKECNKTVINMRTPIQQNGSGHSLNMIQGFDNICLGKDVSSLTLSSCRKIYDSYIDKCLSTVSDVKDQRIVNRVGLLLVAKGKFKGMPACTATIISNQYLLTARHCYVGKDGDEEGGGNDYLTFALNPGLENLNKSFNGQIMGELTVDGVKDINILKVLPTISQDIIILVLKEEIKLGKSDVIIKFAQDIKNWQQLTLLGYQEMLTRKDDLYSQGFHLPEGKTTRYFLQNFLMDNSKSCFVGAYKPGGFQHSCQSLYGTSGAPLFIGDLKERDITDNTIYIAGIQSRGNESAAINLEQQGAPNSAASINALTVMALSKAGVNMH